MFNLALIYNCIGMILISYVYTILNHRSPSKYILTLCGVILLSNSVSEIIENMNIYFILIFLIIEVVIFFTFNLFFRKYG